MDTLNELVKVLSNADYERFIAFLEQQNKRSDVKNIALLKFIKTDDIDGVFSLYPNLKNDRNAYHALRKRLTDALVDFLMNNTLSHHVNDVIKAQQCLVLGRFLLEKQLTSIALKQLKKAADLALLTEQYGLLNEIYLLQLQHVVSFNKVELNSLINKLQVNQAQLLHEGKMHIAFATIRNRLSNIQLKNEVINLTDLITDTLNELDLDIEAVINYKSIYQILHIANEYAAIYQDYSLIETYIIKSETLLDNMPLVSASTSYYKLSIHYYLANFYFRNHHFEKCALYLNQLNSYLKQDSRYYEEFYARVRMLKSLVKFYTNEWEQAVEIAENILLAPVKDIHQRLDIYVCLVMYYGVVSNEKALYYLSFLNHTDAWYEKQKGMLWSVRKNLMEIVMHLQFQNIELAQSRLISFKRRYSSFLKKANENRVLEYLKIVESGILKNKNVAHEVLIKRLNKLLIKDGYQDIFILSFEAWLIGTLEKKSPYTCIINKIGNLPKI